MPHGFDYTSSVTYGDTFPSKGKARVQRIILPQIRTITAYSDPSVSFAASSPYAGEPRDALQKICTAPTGSETPWFLPLFRYRATAKNVSVAASMRL